jgi:hypothetical protein
MIAYLQGPFPSIHFEVITEIICFLEGLALNYLLFAMSEEMPIRMVDSISPCTD